MLVSIRSREINRKTHDRVSAWCNMDICLEIASEFYKQQPPWPESASEKYRPTAATLVSVFANRGCHVVSVTDPHGRIIDFLDRSLYFFFQVALE
jgi:hypothetical protein